MHIAICEDNKEDLANILLLLEKYKQEHNAFLTYTTFNSGVDLLSKEKNCIYTLYLLDVIMPLVNGVEVAKEIRNFNPEAKIIFLTSSPEFAVESYSVNATDYILKPVNEDRFFSVLDNLLINIQKPQEGLTIKTKNSINRILFSRLSYVEVMNKKVYFHLSDNSIRVATARLSEFENILCTRPEFMRVHRSYIVNLYEIDQITQNKIITHQGKIIPVSRSLYKEIRDTYVKQMFCEEEKN